ncbi:MAG: Fe2+/Zn2+ uptake regulation protein-like protein [Solirubrobacterales bacterium]|nr:Fe2+/Zn2+ uptake regulation protein-like protein [Solirubrobacterales bacterium]
MSALAAERVLRRNGLRVSTARRLVLEALHAAGEPVSAEQIAGGLGGRFPRSDLASVYRNLDTLQRVGVVRHVHLGHTAGRYAPAEKAPSDYVVCEDCGTLTAVAAGTLDAARDAVRAATGFVPSFSHVPLTGRCAECAAAEG